MTTGIKGTWAEQIQELERKKKEIEEKSQLCEIIKTDVIEELEKEYGIKSFKEFKKEFDEFLNLLEDHLETNSSESKKSLIDKISVLRDLKKW